MNSKETQSTAAYAVLGTSDGYSSTVSARCGDASWYPGTRRVPSRGCGPPLDTVLVKTGGNALQAVPRSIFEKNIDGNLLAVIAPANVVPGDTIFITPPDGTGRMIAAVVPQGIYPGHTFFVDIPRLEFQHHQPRHYDSPLVVAGILIEDQQIMLVEDLRFEETSDKV